MIPSSISSSCREWGGIWRPGCSVTDSADASAPAGPTCRLWALSLPSGLRVSASNSSERLTIHPLFPTFQDSLTAILTPVPPVFVPLKCHFMSFQGGDQENKTPHYTTYRRSSVIQTADTFLHPGVCSVPLRPHKLSFLSIFMSIHL